VGGLVVEATVRREELAVRVALAVGPGETVAVVGAMGSGKSTALALVAGRVAATAGRVIGPTGVWDDPARGVWVGEADRDVALLPQRPHLVDDVPALDQVAAALAVVPADPDHPGVHAGADREGARLRAASVLAALGIPEAVAARDGWTLSGGEAQRVALAAAVTRPAGVLLLDDPFLALDARAGRVARDWLAGRLARHRGCVLVVCSDPADAERLADRVVRLG
jgi:molybdate transport system ATP-binding protein